MSLRAKFSYSHTTADHRAADNQYSAKVMLARTGVAFCQQEGHGNHPVLLPGIFGPKIIPCPMCKAEVVKVEKINVRDSLANCMNNTKAFMTSLITGEVVHNTVSFPCTIGPINALINGTVVQKTIIIRAKDTESCNTLYVFNGSHKNDRHNATKNLFCESLDKKKKSLVELVKKLEDCDAKFRYLQNKHEEFIRFCQLQGEAHIPYHGRLTLTTKGQELDILKSAMVKVFENYTSRPLTVSSMCQEISNLVHILNVGQLRIKCTNGKANEIKESVDTYCEETQTICSSALKTVNEYEALLDYTITFHKQMWTSAYPRQAYRGVKIGSELNNID